MPLTTKILLPARNNDQAEIKLETKAEVEAYIVRDHSNTNSKLFSAKLFAKGISSGFLGLIRYEFRSDCLYISHMSHRNKNRAGDWIGPQYRHVGTALIEFAIRESMKRGKNGNVKLGASWQSHLFHFGMGFRAINDKKFVAGMDLRKCYEEYCQAQDEAAKLVCQQKIISNKDYPSYQENALKNLHRAEGAEVSFQEVLDHGFFDSVNAELQSFYDEQKATNKKHDFTYYGAIEMYLPSETLALMKVKYAIDNNQIVPELQADLAHAEFVISEKNKMHNEKAEQIVADHKKEMDEEKSRSTLQYESLRREKAAEQKAASNAFEIFEQRILSQQARLDTATRALNTAEMRIFLLQEASQLMLNITAIIGQLKHYVAAYENYTSSAWQFFPIPTHKESGRVYAREHLAEWQRRHAGRAHVFRLQINAQEPLTHEMVVELYRVNLRLLIEAARENVVSLPGTNVSQHSYRAYLLSYANYIERLNALDNDAIFEIVPDVPEQTAPAPLQEVQALMAVPAAEVQNADVLDAPAPAVNGGPQV